MRLVNQSIKGYKNGLLLWHFIIGTVYPIVAQSGIQSKLYSHRKYTISQYLGAIFFKLILNSEQTGSLIAVGSEVITKSKC